MPHVRHFSVSYNNGKADNLSDLLKMSFCNRKELFLSKHLVYKINLFIFAPRRRTMSRESALFYFQDMVYTLN